MSKCARGTLTKALPCRRRLVRAAQKPSSSPRAPWAAGGRPLGGSVAPPGAAAGPGALGGAAAPAPAAVSACTSALHSSGSQGEGLAPSPSGPAFWGAGERWKASSKWHPQEHRCWQSLPCCRGAGVAESPLGAVHRLQWSQN